MQHKDIYINTYIYYMHTYNYIYTYSYIYIQYHTYIQLCSHRCIYTQKYLQFIYIYIHTNSYIYIYSYTYIHTDTYMDTIYNTFDIQICTYIKTYNIHSQTHKYISYINTCRHVKIHACIHTNHIYTFIHIHNIFIHNICLQTYKYM